LQLRHHISTSYLEALSWICKYYYRGVASWSWYYPFHYSPFFSDLEVVEIPDFQLGEPFKPFEQLMAVLPPKTSTALPAHLRYLMTSSDSPIADYFPSEFEIDLTGKKFAWLGEVLLPFIDDQRLLRAMGNYE
jgi:5'-3' exoribonuclease 2